MQQYQDEHEIDTIITCFPISGTFLRAEKFGSGLINDTYLCSYRDGKPIRKYILQRINASVFRKPEQVMENVELVTSHIVKRLHAEGVQDPYTVTPALIHVRSGGSHYRDPSGCFWRVFHFIESGFVSDSIIDISHAHEVGRALGRFQALVADLPPGKLNDTLPGFHHTPRYLKEYDDALRAEAGGRAAGARPELEFVEQRRGLAPLLTDLLDKGELPVRVVHNDPKVNNVMIHESTRQALCMLDLDTVKPGTVLFDFGDCVRSAANRAGEDAPDPASARIDLSLYRAVAKGYLREAEAFLTRKERELLPLSVKVITFELGLRFLADYLRGDTYFKIKYQAHNLHRARVQFKLLESIEQADLGSVL